MISRIKSCLALLFVVAAVFPSCALAAKAAKEKDLGAFGSWRAYAYEEGGQTVCYMLNTKTVKSVGPKKRKAPYLMVTHRPIEASIDVISYGAGTVLDSQHDTEMSVSGGKFSLFSARDTAWARDTITDHKIVKALLAAKQVKLSGVPNQSSSNAVSDVFDLNGGVEAYTAINKACGLPVPASVKKAVVKKDPKKPEVKATGTKSKTAKVATTKSEKQVTAKKETKKETKKASSGINDILEKALSKKKESSAGDKSKDKK